MSMHEALRRFAGKVPWLTKEGEQGGDQAKPPTAIEEAEALVSLAKTPGSVDRDSPTWVAVCCWAAKELIMVQKGLEIAGDEKAAALRARARTLRDLLAMDSQENKVDHIQDDGPYVP